MMLNRNGIFGNRNEQFDAKGNGVSANPVNVGTTSARSNAPAEQAPSAASAARTAADKSPTPKIEEAQGSKLIVGPNIKLKGVEINDCDTLVVEGHVEATMDSRAIQIAESGTFSGTAGIDIADVHGSFTGELTVRTKLVIHSTGKVSGKVRYGKLVIEEGGEISGDVKTIHQAGDTPMMAANKPVLAHQPQH